MKAKRILIVIMALLIAVSLTACIGDKINARIVAMGIKDKSMQRIAITNSRYAGRYTIIDKKAIENFTRIVLNASDAEKTNYLEPDFIFEFYNNENNVVNLKYIAGINDSNIANLIAPDGKMYHVSTSVENEFMKRLVKGNNSENIQEYYISLIELLIGKISIKSSDVVVVDISKDYVVTRSITSIEQKNIIDSVQSKAKIKFPSEAKTCNYLIEINTSKYSDETTDAEITITNKKSKTKYVYIVAGIYENGNWNYHIKYK
jgi:hypothetical protein